MCKLNGALAVESALQLQAMKSLIVHLECNLSQVINCEHVTSNTSHDFRHRTEQSHRRKLHCQGVA